MNESVGVLDIINVSKNVQICMNCQLHSIMPKGSISVHINRCKKEVKAVNVATANGSNVTLLFIKSIDDARLSKNVCKVTMYTFFGSDSDGNF